MDVPLDKVALMMGVYIEMLKMEPDIERLFPRLGYDLDGEIEFGRLVLGRVMDLIAEGKGVL